MVTTYSATRNAKSISAWTGLPSIAQTGPETNQRSLPDRHQSKGVYEQVVDWAGRPYRKLTRHPKPQRYASNSESACYRSCQPLPTPPAGGQSIFDTKRA